MPDQDKIRPLTDLSQYQRVDDGQGGSRLERKSDAEIEARRESGFTDLSQYTRVFNSDGHSRLVHQSAFEAEQVESRTIDDGIDELDDDPGTAGGANIAVDDYLRIKRVSDTQVSVSFGSVGNAVPNNVETEVTINDATRNVYLKVVVSKDSFGRYIPNPAIDPTIQSVLASATQPVSDGPDETTGEPGTDFYILLGTVFVSGGEITGVSNTGNGSFGMTLVVVGKLCIPGETEEDDDEIVDVKDIVFYRMQPT